jgi:hypothetical protein
MWQARIMARIFSRAVTTRVVRTCPSTPDDYHTTVEKEIETKPRPCLTIFGRSTVKQCRLFEVPGRGWTTRVTAKGSYRGATNATPWLVKNGIGPDRYPF